MRLVPNGLIHEADVVDVGAGLVGLSGAGVINDFGFARVIDAAVPTLAQNHQTTRKFVDGGTTILAAAGVGAFLRHVLRQPTWAQWAQYGGTLLGGGRIASGLFSLVGLKYQLSEVTPIDSQVGNIFNPRHPAVQMAAAQMAAALPPGAAADTVNVYSTIPAAGSAGPGGLI